MIDLRSDTVTKPTPGMLKVMVDAEVGDDVFGEDPTVNRFQNEMAEMFGMEAGLFVPSGTMCNQLCLNVLTNAGDEVIIDETGHIFNYETGAAAHLSSIQLRPLKGGRGKLTKELIESAIRPQNEWDPLSRVIAIENSTNKGGGACYSREELIEISNIASKLNLAVHLDGARIWNAMIATGIEPAFFGSVADTISISFSKGLGAPVGSMMLSSKGFVKKARRMRKMWGGGMRQTGLLAAAANYAVDHHWVFLEDDHRRAKKFSNEISKHHLFSIDPELVETNIVLFEVKSGNVDSTLKQFSEKGVLMVPFGGKMIRATFHSQITDDDLHRVLQILNEF